MRNIVIIVLGSLIMAAGFNLFMIPHHILSSGLSGIAMMLGILTPLNTGILNLLLNLPLLIIGWFKLGKRFITYTILSVVVTSAGLLFLPILKISSDPLLSCVFGGVLVGVGAGVTFRASGSTGGLDIIAMLLMRRRSFPLGALLGAMNAVVVLISGFIFGWDLAMLTLVGIYTSSRVIDTVHTSQIKLTLMIITKKGNELKDVLLAKLERGITVIEGKGAYSGSRQEILMTVITRYQLADVRNTINEIDPHAFVNITQTTDVIGLFRKS
ncbi:YitT family protein [Bacillus benzoevorans]|uniref:Uncharacterized membrane-anchored protein YitT (DUF2179 family) n=1 Tax=Bacillus benzoevorans TaxID=1456 RepID=A0A7X0HTX8_9BACI|nr:YitT family protein [Bacillus benzoevorans]MBB6446763.1 uncharacterized membrane-anchored protein YitT (DUF2179 family) [Bacillus benzoevorans]